MSLHPSRTLHSYYRYFYLAIFVFIILYVLFKGVQSFSESLFMSKNNRINVLFYGPESTYYSIDKNDARHYMMYFSPELKVKVPGGYKNYRVGSLGKLAKLEQEPELIQKTFSVATTSFVNLYFYPGSEEVYYGDTVPTEKKEPSASQIFFSKSNGNFFDRLYLYFAFLDKNSEEFHIIAYREKVNAIQDDVYFQEDSFIKESIGLLYQKKYREEQKSIQILYSSQYAVANTISSLLEGNGIRVSDISLDIEDRKDCVIIDSSEIVSVTATDLSTFFNCPVIQGQTDVYDIIFILGEAEKKWEVFE